MKYKYTRKQLFKMLHWRMAKEWKKDLKEILLEKQPDQTADEERCDFCLGTKEQPEDYKHEGKYYMCKSSFHKPSVQECEHCYEIVDKGEIKKTNGCVKCDKPKPSVQECEEFYGHNFTQEEIDDNKIRNTKFNSYLDEKLKSKEKLTKSKFEIEELPDVLKGCLDSITYNGTELNALNINGASLLVNKINQIISYLREHHE